MLSREAKLPRDQALARTPCEFRRSSCPVETLRSSWLSLVLLPSAFERQLELLVTIYGGVISPFRSQRASQVWPSFQRNTWPLIKRQLRSTAAIERISSSVSGSDTTASRLAR